MKLEFSSSMVTKAPLIVVIILLNPISSVIIPTNSQAPALPDEDSNTYLGYYWGAAGIASGLMKLSVSNILDNSQKLELNRLALAAIDTVWDYRYQLENGTKIAAWSKYEDGDIYPGLKYGVAGISNVFIEAYAYSNDQKYLDWAIESIDELFLEISNNSVFANWPYSYSDYRDTFGIPITDKSFGSLGILESTLKLYKVTGNQNYLGKALETYQWLESISKIYNSNNLSVNLLPWYIIDDNSGPLYSSLYSGNAAAIPLFIELGELSNNQTIIQWGYDIANLYIQIQKDDGSWPVIINKPESISRTTVELGAAGIIQSLNILIQKQFPNITDTVENGIKWIVSQINRTNGQFFIPIEPNRQSGRNSVFSGLTGILQSIRLSNQSGFDDILSEGYYYL
ncbi:MAG: hypothetical protein ACC656_01525, partial [Candidatus Heimdallarchaeota archaeon]